MPRYSLRTLIVVMLLGGPLCAVLSGSFFYDLFLFKYPSRFDRGQVRIRANTSVGHPLARWVDSVTPWWGEASRGVLLSPYADDVPKQ
jgi:hypothetical protein